MTICEDIWQPGGPIAVARKAEAGLVLCINGSPYERNKDDMRLRLNAERAAEADATLAYVNLVGGQDELVFDGDSMVVTAAGELLARAPQFQSDLLVADLDLPAATSQLEGEVDALDGTHMRVVRVMVPDSPIEARDPEPATDRRAARRPRRGVGRPRHRHPRLRPQEPLHLGRARVCPAGSTRR